MGILPLQFRPGESRQSLGLSGAESFTIRGVEAIAPGAEVSVQVGTGNTEREFTAVARLDNQSDVEYLRHGGVLNVVLRQLMRVAAG
jgi:aconitate hydratase